MTRPVSSTQSDVPEIDPDRHFTDRHTFMSRIHKALESQPGRTIAEPIPDVDQSLARVCQPSEDLPARFAEQAQEVGMHVHRVASNALDESLQEILKQLQCRSAVLGITDESLQTQIHATLTEIGLDVFDKGPGTDRDALFDADVAITDVDAGLAETGSIILSSGAQRSRACHLAPPVHIALVLVNKIVADLIDYFGPSCDVGDSQHGSATVLITGPSKTADIEGILITGVHGPGEVHVMMIDPT